MPDVPLPEAPPPGRWSVSLPSGLRAALTRVSAVFQRQSVRLTVQVVVVTLSLAYLAWSFRGISATLPGLKIAYGLIAAAGGLVLAAVGLGALTWWSILRGLGQAVAWLPGARVHMLSNLAKYVPGYAWQLVGKAYLTRQLKIAAPLVALAMTIDLTELILIGCALAALLLPLSYIQTLGAFPPGFLEIVRWGGFGLAGLGALAAPYVLARFTGQGAAARAGRAWLSLAAVSALTSWILFGLAFWMLGASLKPIGLADIPFFMFSLVVSILFSLAVIFVPSGIGVRESLIVFVLGPIMSPPLAVIVAALLRVIVAVAELSGAGIIELCSLFLRWRQGNSSREHTNAPS